MLRVALAESKVNVETPATAALSNAVICPCALTVRIGIRVDEPTVSAVTPVFVIETAPCDTVIPVLAVISRKVCIALEDALSVVLKKRRPSFVFIANSPSSRLPVVGALPLTALLFNLKRVFDICQPRSNIG